MYINFQQNRVIRSFKTVHTNLFANNRKLHTFATCNQNFKKSRLSDMHYPPMDIQADFQINIIRPIRYQYTAKIKYFYRQQTYRRTDGRTDVAYDNNRCFLFRKKKKLLKNGNFLKILRAKIDQNID